MTEHTTRFIPADFLDKIEEYYVYDDDEAAPAGSWLTRMWTKRKGTERLVQEIVGKQKGKVDGEKLAHDLALAINQLESDCFQVTQILPITSGAYRFSNYSNSAYGYGYGYTAGVMVVAKR